MLPTRGRPDGARLAGATRERTMRAPSGRPAGLQRRMFIQRTNVATGERVAAKPGPPDRGPTGGANQIAIYRSRSPKRRRRRSLVARKSTPASHELAGITMIKVAARGCRGQPASRPAGRLASLKCQQTNTTGDFALCSSSHKLAAAAAAADSGLLGGAQVAHST